MNVQPRRSPVRRLLAVSILAAVWPGLAPSVEAGRELASNLSRLDDGTEIISPSRWLASQFKTDGSSYVLDSVKLRLLVVAAGAIDAAIYSDAGGKPGTLLGTLNQQGTITAAPSNVLFRSKGQTNGTMTRTSKLTAADLAKLMLPGGVKASDFLGAASQVTTSAQMPAGLILDPNTKYWIVSRARSGQYASEYTADETGTGAGFTPTWAHSETSGRAWTPEALNPLIYAAIADPYVPANLIELRVDQEAINSAVFSGIPMALAQREVAFIAAREAQRSVYVAKHRYLGEPVAELGWKHGWEFFTSAGYGSTDQDNRTPAAGFQTDLFSGTVGVQKQVCRAFTLGGAVTYLDSSNGLGLNTGKVDLAGTALSAFGTFEAGPVVASLFYGYGNFEHDIRRDTLYGKSAFGTPSSRTHTLALDLGTNFKLGDYTTGPIASLTYITGTLDGYRENGGSTARLEFDEQNFDSLVSQIGWQIARSFETHGLTIVPQLRASWWHEYRNGSESVSARLIDSPFQLGAGDSFQHVGGFSTSADSLPPGEDALELGGSITVAVSDRFSITADYLGRILQDSALTHSVVLSGKLAF